MKNIVYCCLFYTLFFISCSEKPEALFKISKSNVETMEKLEIINNSLNADKFYWDFGDGSFSENENPEKLYVKSGEYRISLKAKNNKREAEFAKTILVNAANKKFIGNYIGVLISDSTVQNSTFRVIADDDNENNIFFSFDESENPMSAKVIGNNIIVPKEEKYQGNGITTNTFGSGNIKEARDSIFLELKIEIEGPGFLNNKNISFSGKKI